jgi:transcriptional regulator with XRE-family HTH domain
LGFIELYPSVVWPRYKVGLREPFSPGFGDDAGALREQALQTTMKDVAEHLGISPSTVSRALSNTGYVSQELRAKIERVAIELDYRPDLLARNLRKQFTNMIGLILPDLRNPHDTDTAQALESLLADTDTIRCPVSATKTPNLNCPISRRCKSSVLLA